MAALLDIEIDLGGYYARNLQALAGDGETPWDMTGCTFCAEVRSQPGGALVASLQVLPLDLAAGDFRLVLDDRARLLTRGPELIWDLVVTDPLSIPHKLLYGRVIRAETHSLC